MATLRNTIVVRDPETYEPVALIKDEECPEWATGLVHPDELEGLPAEDDSDDQSDGDTGDGETDDDDSGEAGQKPAAPPASPVTPPAATAVSGKPRTGK